MSLPNSHLLRAKRERAGGNPGDHQISLGGLKSNVLYIAPQSQVLGGLELGQRALKLSVCVAGVSSTCVSLTFCVCTQCS